MVDQKYCRNCGTPNLPDAKFCANCGATIVSAAASPSGTAPSAAPTPLRQQAPYSPPPRPRTIFGLSRKMIVVGLVVVVLLLTLGCVALMANTPSTTTTTNPTATQAATTPPQATATPTATPTSSGLSTQEIVTVAESALTSQGYTVVSPASPTTFQVRTAYAGVYSKDGQTYEVTFIRMGSNSDALSYQQQLINGYVAQGYTKDTASSTSDMWIGDLIASSSTGTVAGVHVITTQDISLVAVYTANVSV